MDLSTAKSGTEVNSALASGRPEAGFSRMMMGSVGDRAEGGGMDTGGPALPVPVPGIVVNTPLMMLLARRELPKPMMRVRIPYQTIQCLYNSPYPTNKLIPFLLSLHCTELHGTAGIDRGAYSESCGRGGQGPQLEGENGWRV